MGKRYFAILYVDLNHKVWNTYTAFRVEIITVALLWIADGIMDGWYDSLCR